MATIRLKEWTKDRIDALMNEEEHSSHDSVVKSLLKDREYASTLRERESGQDGNKNVIQPEVAVFADLNYVEDGLLFLYCPNCGDEVAHITTDPDLPLGTIDLDCSGCNTNLTPHGLIVVSQAYSWEDLENNREKRIKDFRDTAISYWHRALKKDWSHLNDAYSIYSHDLADKIYRQYRQFGSWEWPEDIPVVTLEQDRSYTVGTGQNAESWQVEQVKERNSLHPTFVIRRRSTLSDPTKSNAKTEEIEWTDVREKIINRRVKLNKSDTSASVSM